MNEFRTVLSAVIPVFAISGAGFVLRRCDWLTEEADKSLLRLTINLLMPCLILDAALGNAALFEPRNLVLAPLVGAGTVALGLLVARLCTPWVRLENPAAKRTFALSVGLYNYGFIPIPLAMLLFKQETMGVLFVHNLGVEAAMWTIGLMVLTGTQVGKAWRKIINAPLIAMALALGLNFSGAHHHLPAEALTTVRVLGSCAIPMSLILAGATVADHLAEFHSAQGWRTIGWAVGLRIVLLPACFLLLAKYLPASAELKRVIILEAAMPSAVFPIVMTRHYGGDPATALRVIVATSAVGLLTIPLWIRFGLRWVGV